MFEMQAKCLEQQIVWSALDVASQLHQVWPDTGGNETIDDIVEHLPAEGRKGVCTSFRGDQRRDATGQFGFPVPVAQRIDARRLLGMCWMKVNESFALPKGLTYFARILCQPMIPLRINDDHGLSACNGLCYE